MEQQQFKIIKYNPKYAEQTVEIKPAIYKYGLEYAIDESRRAEITPILNKLALKLRNVPLVPDCSFVSADRYTFIKKITKLILVLV